MQNPIRASTLALFLLVVTRNGVNGQTDPGASFSPWEGEITGMNVYIRSGAGTNFYPTTKLHTGDRVLVLGEQYGWFRILPPPDSFSYIDTTLVALDGEGKTGIVTADRAYVRAGSHLVNRKAATQIVLGKGDRVEIIGQADGFHKIQPPPRASLFVSKQYVQRVPEHLTTGVAQRYAARTASSSARPLVPTTEQTPSRPTKLTAAAAVNPSGAPIPPRNDGSNQPGSSAAPTEPETGLDHAENAPPIRIDPTIQAFRGEAQPSAPSIASQDSSAPKESPFGDEIPAAPVKKVTGRYAALLATVESDLNVTMGLAPEQRDLESLLGRYGEIADQQEDRIAAEFASIRMQQLRDLDDLRKAGRRIVTQENDLRAFRDTMNEQRMKIMRVRARATLEKFDLEGELRKSYAFAPEKRRFRLVDPKRQTTIAYVDVPVGVQENVAHMIGRVVGIRTAGQRYSPSARVPIAIAASITDLTLRSGQPGPVPDRGDLSNRVNTPAETPNSSTAARQAGAEADPQRTAVATGGEGEQDP